MVMNQMIVTGAKNEATLRGAAELESEQGGENDKGDRHDKRVRTRD